MVRAENACWLLEVRDKVAQAHSLEPDEVERLAHGFVICNVAMDLARLARRLLAGRPWVLVNNVTYWQVGQSLLTAANDSASTQRSTSMAREISSQGKLECLVNEAAARDARTRWGRRNPWREINFWVACEAVLRLLPGQRQQSVYDWSRGTFARIVKTRVSRPAACCQRNSRVSEGFRKWWVQTVETLCQLWQQNSGAAVPKGGVQSLAVVLGDRLVASDLVQLLAHKNIQLRICIGQINGDLEPPVSAGWLHQTISRLLFTSVAQRDCLLKATDCRHLASLVLWTAQNRLGAGVAGSPANDSLLWGFVRNADQPTLVPAVHVHKLLCEIKELERAVRMRRLPADWGRSLHVQDLFCSPVRWRFRRWRQLAASHGL